MAQNARHTLTEQASVDASPEGAAVSIPVVRLDHGRSFALPAYATPGSAGMDVVAAINAPYVLKTGARHLFPTGLRFALPQGYEAQLRSRSGLAFKYGLFVLNSPATIDADYRGEVKVLLMNGGQEDFTVEPGLRLAQMVITPVTQAVWKEVNTLSNDTVRGQGGFGSTGLS